MIFTDFPQKRTFFLPSTVSIDFKNKKNVILCDINLSDADIRGTISQIVIFRASSSGCKHTLERETVSASLPPAKVREKCLSANLPPLRRG